MRRAIRGALACLTAGCSLVMPPSDYFDERGIETIGVADNVQEIALSGSWLFVHDGTLLQRVPARDRVGSPVEIARTTHPSGLHSLVAMGDLVAWCDGDGGAFYASGDGRATELPGGGPCGRVAVGGDAVIELVPGQDESRLRRYVVSQKAFDPELRLSGPGGSAMITATAEGTVVAATGAGILRECLPGDVGCEEGWCRLSAIDREIGSRGFYLTSGPAGGRPLLVTALSAILFAATTECCALDDPTCALDSVRSLRGSSSAESFAVRDGSVYALRQGRIARVWSFPDPARDVAVGPASPSARLLALGPEYAYFVDGSQIERAPLGGR